MRADPPTGPADLCPQNRQMSHTTKSCDAENELAGALPFFVLALVLWPKREVTDGK